MVYPWFSNFLWPIKVFLFWHRNPSRLVLYPGMFCFHANNLAIRVDAQICMLRRMIKAHASTLIVNYFAILFKHVAVVFSYYSVLVVTFMQKKKKKKGNSKIIYANFQKACMVLMSLWRKILYKVHSCYGAWGKKFGSLLYCQIHYLCPKSTTFRTCIPKHKFQYMNLQVLTWFCLRKILLLWIIEALCVLS